MADVKTLNDLAAEFDRIAAMPDETFFSDGTTLYMNIFASADGDHSREPTFEEGDKYAALQKLTSKLEKIACDTLITEDGKCNWANINALKSMGYDVYPTDQDSFGWLCAAIEKNNHVMIYG